MNINSTTLGQILHLKEHIWGRELSSSHQIWFIRFIRCCQSLWRAQIKFQASYFERHKKENEEKKEEFFARALFLFQFENKIIQKQPRVTLSELFIRRNVKYSSGAETKREAEIVFKCFSSFTSTASFKDDNFTLMTRFWVGCGAKQWGRGIPGNSLTMMTLEMLIILERHQVTVKCDTRVCEENVDAKRFFGDFTLHKMKISEACRNLVIHRIYK